MSVEAMASTTLSGNRSVGSRCSFCEEMLGRGEMGENVCVLWSACC